jgi:iron complex transport system ATP-binding protein
VLLLDEPTSNLDLRHQLEVMEIVSGMVHEKKLSAVMAIHDLNLASRFSDKLAMLVKGKIYAKGPADLLLSAENMADIFGIEALVMNVSGRPYVVPIRSIDGASFAKA